MLFFKMEQVSNSDEENEHQIDGTTVKDAVVIQNFAIL